MLLRRIRPIVAIFTVNALANAAIAEQPQKDALPHRALLVGCGEYEHHPNSQLHGPKNDVRLMCDVLQERGFAAEHVRILSDEQGPGVVGRGTYENIKAEFKLLEDVRPGQRVVILLSGHGDRISNKVDPQSPDPDDRDGFDETFLPVDVKKNFTTNAIVDDDLFKWCKAIVDRGAFVWIIFDCCHSGEGIRGGLDETVREMSRSEPLVPGPIPPASNGTSSERFKSDLDLSRLVAFYACQSHQKTVERRMPYYQEGEAAPQSTKSPTSQEKPKTHGIFTYIICKQLRENAGREISYRDLAASVWAEYRWLGRYEPIPYADGEDSGLSVLGSAQPKRQFAITPTESGEFRINGGDLDGLRKFSVLAIYPPKASSKDLPLGYAAVTRLGIAESQIMPVQMANVPGLPKEFLEPKLRGQLPENCYGVLAYLDYGDSRLPIAADIDQPGITAEDRHRLVQLQSQLSQLVRPDGVFRMAASLTEAEWVVQIHGGQRVLVERTFATAVPPRSLKPLDPRFKIANDNSAEMIVPTLQKIFRANNLLKISKPAEETPRSASEFARMDVKVEMFRYRNSGGEGEQVIDWKQSLPQIYPGQYVGWRVTNQGRMAVDITLLYIDADLNIQAVFPSMRSIAANNRLLSKESYRTHPIEVTDTPVGNENVVMIALQADGPPKDYRILAAPSAEAAKAIEQTNRGPDDNVTYSRFGRLLMHSAFGESLASGHGLRGGKVNEDVSSSLVKFSWQTTPK